jgi:hypothetical protein
MQLTQLQDSSTLLTYSLMTTPAPVQVSPSSTSPSLATLTYVVSCPRSIGAVNVAQIIIILPVDAKVSEPDPTNLAAVAPPKSSASISSTGTDEWKFDVGVAPNIFIFTPKDDTPVHVTLQSLTITFTGIQVNALVGTALVKISEWAASGNGTPPPVTDPPLGTASIAVPKFPYGFFAGNLGTDKPMIENGQRPTLTWVGSKNATYKMLGSTQTQDVSNIRTWSASSNPQSPALTDTTTFILQVSAQEGGQTVTEYFSLTVIVANPSFTARDLTVLTTAALQGTATVGKVGAPANLVVNGNVNASDITGTGNVTASKNVSGVDVTASGNMKATGNVNGTDITATGNLSASKNLNVTGTLTTSGLGTIPNLNVGGTINAGRVVGGSLQSNGGLQVYGTMRVDVGDTAAAGFYNNSSAPVVYARNTHSNRGAITGLNVLVGSNYDYGVSSNGYVGSYSGSALLTHLPTRNGHRVVTSPLSVEAEVQASGSAKLTKGKATVQFEADVMDMILHNAEHTYRVLLTATGQCNGLAVVNKSGDSFIVEELNNGTSDASFDWFIIARKPEELGAPNAATLPEKLPDLVDLDLQRPDEK